jgi:hypothetical protein
MEKKDMGYTCTILMNIKVACLLFKLAHASTICNVMNFLLLENPKFTWSCANSCMW